MLLLGLGPRGWLELGRASVELALARWRLGAWTTAELLRHSPGVFTSHPAAPANPAATAMAARVGFAVTRMGARVPWRSDCLVQALAAQHWLDARRIPSSLWIGVRTDCASGFEAHAWLKVGDLVVTGGDITPFHPLVLPKPG